MSCYRDLNPGPLPYQGSALPLSYNSNWRDKSSGQRWIRTTEGISQQIYSLPHLATLVFARFTKDPFPLPDSTKNRILSQESRCDLNIFFLFLSLLSDSNQRPRDYKSRALAN